MPNLSETLVRSCKYFVPDLKLAMRPHQTNTCLFTQLKTKIPKEEQSGVVYKIYCKDFPATYVGETIQKVCTRFHQHEQCSLSTIPLSQWTTTYQRWQNQSPNTKIMRVMTKVIKKISQILILIQSKWALKNNLQTLQCENDVAQYIFICTN